MRPTTFLIPVCLLAAAVMPARAANVDDLMTVEHAADLNAEVPTYVDKLEALLHERGLACGAISHINAFSTGSGLRTAVACDAGSKRYEIVFEGDSVNITAAN